MVQFTPPTFNQPWLGTRQRGDLWRFYDGVPTGYSVLITSGVATPYPGTTWPSRDDINAADAGSGLGSKAAFVGGRTYIINDAEAAILVAAGYDPTGGGFTSAFGEGFDLVD